MQLRKLVLACGLASFAWSNIASALGLGEITLKSALNEPLSAEVKLVDTRDLSSDQILVALASPADFERNGIDRLYFYTELQFQVVLDSPSGPVVRVTTRNPVREPYLNFLIEARWTAGRLLREYTILMDLPTYEDSAQQALKPAQSGKSVIADTRPAPVSKMAEVQQAQSSEVQKTEQSVPSPVVDESTSTYSEEKPAVVAEQDKSAKKFEPVTGTYGPIGKRDTLWEIAKSVRPDSTVSVHQTMLALQRLNPDAFIRGNINLIKKGKVLRVPDANETASISKSEALSQVRAQNHEWASARTASTETTSELGAQLDASKRTSRDRQEPDVVSGRVKLETPLSKDSAESGKGRGAKKGGGKALDSELSSTLEELDKSKFEKSELSSRVKELEEQAKTMEKLAAAKSEKLRAMELNAKKLAEKNSTSSKAADPVVIDKPVEATVPLVTPDQVSSVASSMAASSLTASSVAASAIAAPVQYGKQAPVAVEKSIVDTILENLWVVLVAAGVIGVAVFVIRRRKVAEAESHSRFTTEDDNANLFSSEPNFDTFNEPQEEYGHDVEQMVENESALFEDDETRAVAETGDVVGEADIYIAYGKFDQAEDMLLNGLAKDPHSSDIRLKLLEVYSQTQNATEFDKHYAAILSNASDSTKNRAAELRANIAGASGFGGGFSANESRSSYAGVAPVISEEEFSFDLDDDVTVVNHDRTRIQSAPSNATTQRYSLDLDDSPVADSKGASSVKIEEDDEDDFSLDLDSSSDADLGSSNVDLDLDLDFDLDPPEPESNVSDAEDLSEISLALDGLDDDVVEDDDVEVAEIDEEFSFDFNELETETKNATQKVDAIKASSAVDSSGDDFNLELDMNDIDLAALDQEMEGLDADLESLDFDEGELGSTSAKLELPAGDDDDDEEINWSEDDDDFDLEPAEPSAIASVTAVQNALPLMEDDDISDDVFDQALSEFSADNLDVSSDADMLGADLDSELDFMADADESATKLDLARAYIDMGDNDGARDILAEVAHEGNEQQRQEAVDLLSRIDV